MATSTTTTTNNKSPATALYRGRLMRDINELCKPPCYPNIKLHPPTDNADGKMGHACLLLSTQVYGNVPLHLTVEFPDDYPVRPPRISMDTPNVTHPNIFGRYICASILNTTEGYTSAYTLKSVAIQLLSFFSSDSIEQHSGSVVKLDQYHKDLGMKEMRKYVCARCHYDTHDQRSMLRAAGFNVSEMDTAAVKAKNKTVVGAYFADEDEEEAVRKTKKTKVAASKSEPEPKDKKEDGALSVLGGRPIDILTDDVLLLILQKLDDTALAQFTSASKRVKELVEHYDVLRQRELQCFCLKTSYMTSDLGVGVSTRNASTYRRIESEFDLLSREAFATLNVRRSVQSIAFHHWLPVPLSRRHWLRVRNDVVVSLVAIGKDVMPLKKPYYKSEVAEANQRKQGGLSEKQVADLRVPSTVKPTSEALTQATEVLLSFMTQIVVRLNEDVDKLSSKSSSWDGFDDDDSWYPSLETKSALRFASEKAIESYFHLFHLLVCLAAEHPLVANDANRRLRSFYVDNKRGKDDCPNLGMLLVALLIADDASIGVDKEAEAGVAEGGPGTREHLTKAIITEAITRNVVWLLDTKGAGRAELVYLEADNTVSSYRLHHTFVGSQTSYRLLMFMELFRKTARPAGQTLEQVRDGLYRRHGAPPPGAAAHLAAEVRRLQTIKEWPDFMQAMGVRVPSKTNFCNVLRKAVRDSMARGYSSWGLTVDEAFSLRDFHETAFKEGDKWKAPKVARPEYGEGAGRGGRGGRGRGGYRGRDRGHAKFDAGKPLSERVDYALKEMATVRFGNGARGGGNRGPKRSSLWVEDRVAPEYVKWRIDRREVSFFPDKAAKQAGRKGRQ